MRPAKILRSYNDYNDIEITVFAKTVVAAMTGNSYFIGGESVIALLDSANKAYATMLDKSKLGNKVDIASKNERKKELKAALDRVAGYVSNVAINDRTVFISSGFVISKETKSTRLLPSNFNVAISNGVNTGELSIKVEKPRAANIVMIAYSSDEVITDTSIWNTTISTESKCLLTKLTSGTRIWIKASLVGSKQQIVTAPVIQSKYIQ